MGEIAMRKMDAVIMAGLGWLGCMWAGSLLYGAMIFDRQLAAHVFVVGGLAAAVLLAGALLLRSAWYLALMVVVTAGISISAETDSFRIFARDLAFVLGVVATIRLGLAVEARFPDRPIGRFVEWGVISAGLWSAFALLQVAIFSAPDAFHAQLLLVMKHGALFGAGLGVGLDVAAVLRRRRAGAPAVQGS